MMFGEMILCVTITYALGAWCFAKLKKGNHHG
jgi:hypothetical protein